VSGRLVEQQHVSAGEQCPCHPEALALACAHRPATGADSGCKLIGERIQPDTEPDTSQSLGA
jgi:hypothetical protein